MNTYVVRLKNTSAANAFSWLRSQNGKVANGKMIWIGNTSGYVMATPAYLTVEEADALIRSFFSDKVVCSQAPYAGQKDSPALCVALSKTEFVFFGRM